MVSIRPAARLLGALALALAAQAAAAQPPKDPPKDPPKESADEQKAKEAFLAGKLDDALKALEAAARANPALPPPKVVAAQWCVEAQQGPVARQLIEQAATEDPTNPHVLLANARFALNEGRVTETILNCTAALEHSANPRWDAARKAAFQREARLGLVTAYEVRGDYASVKTHLLAILDADPKNAPQRHRLGRANFLVGRYDDAFADFKQAFKDDQTLDPPELTMAQLWAQKADAPKAEEWFAKAVAAHGNSAKVHRDFAGYLLNKGRGDVGKSHLAAAQKLEPSARDTKALAGLFARYSKDYPGATQVFEELVREHPSYGAATFNLALVLAEAGDGNARRRATELAESYVKQNQRSADAWSLYAHTLFKAGRTADAEKAARTVFALGQLSLDGAYFVGRVLADRGATEEAQKVLRAAADKKEWFLYRKDAETLLAELDKKSPPKK